MKQNTCIWEYNDNMSVTSTRCNNKTWIGMIAQIREFKYCPYCGVYIEIKESK